MGAYSIFKDTICDMTWLEVDEASKRGAIMLVPVGVIEQHGPHLPLGTDIYGAYLLCCLAKSYLRKKNIVSVIAPPYYFGMNESTGMFPGSINIRQESMINMLVDLFVSYGKHGFKRQFVLNHHGDPRHNLAIFRAILNARGQDIDSVCIMRPSTERAYKKGGVILPDTAIIRPVESTRTTRARAKLIKSQLHIHAEERETSLIMRWYPNLLKKRGKIKTFKPVLPGHEAFEKAESGGKWRELSPQGYIGDPSVATEENGDLYVYEASDIANAIAEHIRREPQVWS